MKRFTSKSWKGKEKLLLRPHQQLDRLVWLSRHFFLARPRLHSRAACRDIQCDFAIWEKNWQLGERREFTHSSCRGFVLLWLERATRVRKPLGSIPCGAALFFFRLIRQSVLLSLSEPKEERI